MTPLERIAHDVICIVKYGSPGGSASTADVKRVAEYLDSVRPLPPPAVRLPPAVRPPPAVKLPPAVRPPTIRLPFK